MKSIFIGVSGKSVVGWNKINHVDGYLIYRKTSNGKWQKVGDTPYVNSVKSFERGKYSDKFIKSIYRIMETIH